MLPYTYIHFFTCISTIHYTYIYINEQDICIMLSISFAMTTKGK